MANDSFKNSGIEKCGTPYPWESPNMSGPGPVSGGVGPQSIGIQQSINVSIPNGKGIEPAGYSGPMDYKDGSGAAPGVKTTGSGLQGGTCIDSNKG